MDNNTRELLIKEYEYTEQHRVDVSKVLPISVEGSFKEAARICSILNHCDCSFSRSYRQDGDKIMMSEDDLNYDTRTLDRMHIGYNTVMQLIIKFDKFAEMLTSRLHARLDLTTFSLTEYLFILHRIENDIIESYNGGNSLAIHGNTSPYLKTVLSSFEKLIRENGVDNIGLFVYRNYDEEMDISDVYPSHRDLDLSVALNVATPNKLLFKLKNGMLRYVSDGDRSYFSYEAYGGSKTGGDIVNWGAAFAEEMFLAIHFIMKNFRINGE